MPSEEQIRAREKEVHVNVPVKYRGKITRTKTVVGYLKEDIMQADFMQWTFEVYPYLKDFLFHIVNEGDSSDDYARMKASQNLTKGKLAGVFDNHCNWCNPSIWIELKLPGEDFSPRQKRLYDLWTAKGILIFKCDNFDLWKNIIEINILKLW